jgi:hypothetical protein
MNQPTTEANRVSNEDLVEELKSRWLNDILPTGTKWAEKDLKTLAMTAKDAAGLMGKIATATDPVKQQEYRDRLERLADHVGVLALSRVNTSQKKALATLEAMLVQLVRRTMMVLIGPIG